MCAEQTMHADGIVRLSYIEVYPQYLEKYRRYVMDAGETSLPAERGVFTM